MKHKLIVILVLALIAPLASAQTGLEIVTVADNAAGERSCFGRFSDRRCFSVTDIEVVARPGAGPVGVLRNCIFVEKTIRV